MLIMISWLTAFLVLCDGLLSAGEVDFRNAMLLNSSVMSTSLLISRLFLLLAIGAYLLFSLFIISVCLAI